MGVPLNHPFLFRIFPNFPKRNHPAIGYPPWYRKAPCNKYITNTLLLQFAIEHGPVEIVDVPSVPIKSGDLSIVDHSC